MADESRTNAGRPLGASGPVRQDIIDQEDSQRNAVSDQASFQTDASDSKLADRDETGTAAHADRAADRAPEPDHLGAAERAFEESRGQERRGERRSSESERKTGGGGGPR